MQATYLPESDLFRLLLIFGVSVSLTHNIAKKYQKTDRYFIYLSSIFIFIYSGIGWSYVEVYKVYIVYYTIFYYFFLSFFSKFAFGKHKGSLIANNEYFIFNKFNASVFIFVYLLLQFSYSFYPDYSILKLFRIQSYSLNVDYWSLGSQNSTFIVILKYALLLLLPFYLIALHHYKNRSLVLLVLLFMPMYMKIASSGYVARSTLFPYLLVYIGVLFSNSQKQGRRNFIIVFIIFGSLPLFYLLYYLSFIRMGWDTSYITLFDAVNGLVRVETTFPLHFNWVYDLDAPIQPIKYFSWLLMLPIPNFIKGSAFDFQINYSLSVDLLNLSMTSENYYVSLYGMVTNAIYVFGKSISFIQPIIAGTIFGLSYRAISKSSENQILIFYFMFFIIFNYARAGDGATLPLVINQFLLLYIVLAMRKYLHKKRT